MVKAHPPEKCDVCRGILKNGSIYHDALHKMVNYPRAIWGWVCQPCSLRTIQFGPGQIFDSKTDEKVRDI